MCGIVGYVGKKNGKDIIVDGLRELEYRGYDSAGIAYIDEKRSFIDKKEGRLINLENSIKGMDTAGFNVSIGHTRWATHGAPSDTNAHPMRSEKSFIVHNGIIENYKELKEDLIKKGYKFTSETDTEVIVFLFEDILKSEKDAFSAFKKCIKIIKGAYALLLITDSEKDKIFYAKEGSPMIIGEGNEGDIYFASSTAPLAGVCKRVKYLEDGEFGYIKEGEFGKLSDIKELNESKNLAKKDGFRFFMEKEIYEQPRILRDAILGRLNEKEVLFDELDSNFFDGVKNIHICASGTSYYAGFAASYILEELAEINTYLHISSEYRYKKNLLTKDDLFVVISQSGETADTLECLKMVEKKGIKTLLLCNVDNSSMSRVADATILLRAGIEKGVASTKAFASQVMNLWLIAIYIAQKRGLMDESKFKSEREAILSSIEATKKALTLHNNVTKDAKNYDNGHGIFFIGRHIFFPLALEGALKLKELSYLHAEGYGAGEMKHGPIALADSGLYVIALLSNGELREKTESNIAELYAREAKITTISSVDNKNYKNIAIDKSDNYMVEFYSMMIIIQLFAMEVSLSLGNDVDMPRNLAKSVTVE